MSEEPKKIVISSGDLQSKEVDEALSRQMSFGMPSSTTPDRKAAWYYRPWFVLMVAGGLGAFLAWALVEPFFDDQESITGNVEAVDSESRLPQAPHVTGKLVVSGNDVWLLNSGATMDMGDGVVQPLDPRSFKEGQVVTVSGEIAVGSSGALMVATSVVLRPGDTEKYPTEALASRNWRSLLFSLMVFPLVAAFVGLAIGAADGLVSRAYSRAATCALVGMGMGLGVGLVASLLGQVVYMVLAGIAQQVDKGEGLKMSTGAFLLQMMARGIAWALIGVAMGMGQGVALRSKKLLLNGIIGGIVGGLVGGLLFDPINYLIGGGQFSTSADSSRAVGFTVIGLLTGLMVGIVELIAREAWLKMLAGPLAGKEFVLYKDPTTVGSSPKREVYLFKDPEVEPTHALIHRAGEGYEIEDQKSPAGTYVNGRKVSRQRLKSQDQIRIGQTVLLFTVKDD